MSARVNMRIEDGLWAWVDSYAKQRGTSKTAIVESALREFRALAARGVPELVQASVTDAGGGSGRVSKASVPASARARAFMERQRKLNQAKYGGQS